MYKLSPSDLTFLWDECPRCFYLKVVRGFNRPFSPFPKIFSRIDKIMKDYFAGHGTQDLYAGLPAGVVLLGERWVTSSPLSLPGRSSSCYLKGKFDSLVQFNNGSYGLVDFKTSETKPEHAAFYSRQLHAYAYALENPAPGALALSPITRMGLLCVEPAAMQMISGSALAYMSNVTWIEIERDDSAFMDFIDRVLAVLEQSAPPPPGEKCSYCKYRQAARETGE